MAPALLIFLCAVSAKAGEYADSLPKPVPEYHYGAAAVAAGLTLPALYLAYSGNSYLGLVAAATFPPMVGYAIAGNPNLGLPLGRNVFVSGVTLVTYFFYAVNAAGGVATGRARSEEEEARDNQTASDILRYGFFALGPLTLMDFVFIALPFEKKNQKEHQEQKRVSLNVAPDRAVLVYKF